MAAAVSTVIVLCVYPICGCGQTKSLNEAIAVPGGVAGKFLAGGLSATWVTWRLEGGTDFSEPLSACAAEGEAKIALG